MIAAMQVFDSLKGKAADTERHNVAGWIFILVIVASLFVAVAEFFDPNITGAEARDSVLAAGVIGALYFFHIRGYSWPKFTLVAVIALIAGLAYNEPFVTERAHLIVLLPPIMALLVVDKLYQILSTAVLVVLILFVRSQGQGVYFNPENIAIYVIAVASLMLGRYLLEQRTTGLQAANQELARKEQLKTKFVAVVAHEMQTPLTEVRVSAAILKDNSGGDFSEAQEKLLDAVIKSNDEAINRIGAMMTLLDIQENGLKLDPKPAKLADLINSILITKSPEIERKKLKLTTSFPELSAMPIDLEKLRVAVTRLIENAVLYTKEGGTIHLSTVKSEHGQKFSIADSGIGIPSAEQANLFEPFTRASNAYTVSPDGEGVGLTIAKAVVEAHGGSMGFDSQEGKGSTFWFEINETGDLRK
jgi:signal transduction histidine kinase